VADPRAAPYHGFDLIEIRLRRLAAIDAVEALPAIRRA